MNLQYVSKRR